MSESLYVTVGGTTYDLSSLVNYTLLRTAAFGMAPVRRLTQRGPLQHGVSDVGFRLEPRKLQFVLHIQEATPEAYWARRAELMSIFTPTDDPLTLRYVYPSGVVREIQGFYSGGLDLSSDGRLQLAHQVPIEIFCPNPAWADSDEESQVFTGTIAGGTFIPTVIPSFIGGSAVTVVHSVTYSGTWLCYPGIVLQGPCTGMLVENLTTGEKLDLSYPLVAGNTVTFNLAYGQKTVIKQPGAVNLVPYLSNDSDLSTFHLERAPVATGGVNNLQVTISGIVGDTGYATITWQTTDIGL